MYYQSYPMCCANYSLLDPHAALNPPASPAECLLRENACERAGWFEAYGQRNFSWVQTHPLIAFYDNSDPSNTHWAERYA
jgi:hypothetical protein